MVRFSDAQLTEIAFALEASNTKFIWVIPKGAEILEPWLPPRLWSFEVGTHGLNQRNYISPGALLTGRKPIYMANPEEERNHGIYLRKNQPYRNCAKSEFLCGLNDVKVHGCCNGIVCYTKLYQNRKDRGLINLWNPFVKKLKVLPKFREKCYFGEAKKAIGFWFDKEKNDYEVARISYTEVASSVDFFSLRKERSRHWKTVSINLNIGMFQEALIGPEVGSSGPDGPEAYAQGLNWKPIAKTI
ncbi:hypothetical protein AgCh_014847 [Apium graveolens]